MSHHATPARRDKRLVFTVANEATLVLLLVYGLIPAETCVAAMVTLASLYIAQSQAGLTMRSRGAPLPPAAQVDRGVVVVEAGKPSQPTQEGMG